MLQIKELRKEYVTQKSVVTKALDGVTLNFPETGMVFVLGKSGSGKSTLLNLCGGLDKPTAGELILNGKSSKDFKGKDFDSYRNTFVGFVFQEYNIPEEYTVEENVALALELQGKKRNREAIESILDEVGLAELADRKASTLSGGQKQRVAIARALVKQPQIILADEPTGALDSETGAQIFDLLKELSAGRLVLVVSHDRDFAERYADRIIELKDGKVDSDCVRLPDGAFGAIGAQPELPEEPETPQFLRARLPFRHALRMGFGNLKGKPVRLAFSLILCVFAFVLFGLSSTLMFYREQSVVAETIRLDRGTSVTLNKYYATHLFYYYPDGRVEENESTMDERTTFTLTEFENLKKKYPDALAAIRADNRPQNLIWSSDLWEYYGLTPERYVIANSSLKTLAGRLPTAEDEIALPEFVFNAMQTEQSKFVFVTEEDAAAGKLLNEDAPGHPVNTYDDVLYSESNPATVLVTMREGKTFNFKIVGVYRNDKVPKQYRALKKAVESGEYSEVEYRELSSPWLSLRESGFYDYFALSQEFFTKYASLWNTEPRKFEPSEGGTADQKTETKYQFTSDSVIGSVVFQHGRNPFRLNRIVGLTFEDHADDTYYKVTKTVADKLELVHNTVATFRKAFLFAGLGLAVFAFLLMFNLVSVSVVTKKKEIGILRALGARSIDVFVIFFVEALLIAVVGSVAAMIFSAIVCHVLNLMLIETIEAAIFIFGALSALIIVLIAAITAFLATIIPVVNYSKKSPVESIRTP